MLCSKLRRFSYEEIEFFLPQLCHLLISVDNESMALEEFILDLSEESVNGALLVRTVASRLDRRLLFTVRADAAADLLALPNVLSRPLQQPAVERFQDLSEDIQQSAAHCLRRP